MKAVLLIAVFLTLTACSTLPEREARLCDRLGVHHGDPDFWQCMALVDAQHGRKMGAGAAMLSTGGALLQPQPEMQVYVHH